MKTNSREGDVDGFLQTPDGPSAFRCEACLARQPAGDALTGLADRTLFRERLARTLDGHGSPNLRQAPPVPGTAVLLIDLDRFKSVNDTMGHATGDALLVAVAGRIRSSLRDGDLAARLGGDEFAVLLCQIGGHDEVAAVAERLVDLLARPYLLSGRVASVGASIGAATAIAGTGTEGDLLLRQADMAMYQAKSEGRNRHCFFRSEMQDEADTRVALETDLRAALALGQFELFYQPQLDLKLRQLVGFEALIRWRHPTRGLVPPDAFIPVVEQMGLISAIGEWVIREACSEAARWPAPLTVAVNVAAAQFENARLVPTVISALKSSGLPGTLLELEIVETVLLKNDGTVMEQLHALKALGVQISLDDFGTGYSSLTQLRSFPFDRVKIDRSFADDMAVVRAVAALGASLGMRTTAEGVETAEQLERLDTDGCTEAQGYLLSRPVCRTDVAGIITTLLSQPPGAQAAPFPATAQHPETTP
ncbi:MAG: putative bifunctional diguanylate cyclase/phosphodiesterase [Janthinobacterium lividum]